MHRAGVAAPAADVIEKLSVLSQIDLAKIDAYERKNQNRQTVLGRISPPRGEEPWPGYDVSERAAQARS